MAEALHLAEINHRVANSFQLASAMLSLEARREPAVADALERAATQLQAFGLVHRLLQPDAGGVVRVDVGAYLHALIVHLDRACLRGRGVRLGTALETSEVDTALCHHLGLILTELVLNAAKHAFRDRDDGKLKVGFATDREGGWALWVEDDGPGFDFGAADATSGLGLVHRLSRAIGGDCDCHSSPAGARVVVRFDASTGRTRAFPSDTLIKQDRMLDEALDQSFPASDPPAVLRSGGPFVPVGYD